MKTIIALLIAMLPSVATMAQQPESRYRHFDDLIERLAEETENEDEFSDWLEELQELYENPLPLNSASEEELLRIPFLNENTAQSIVRYRERSGDFLSFQELSAVEGIDRETAEKLSFFVTLESSEKVQATSRKKRPPEQQVLTKGWQTFPKQAGYKPREEKPPAYLGSPLKLYTRYGYVQHERFQAGITADKDPGEQFFKGNNKWGFDFYSAHVAIRVNNFIPQLVVGDFTVRAGQGLVMWQGFSTGKSSEALTVAKNMSLVRPYTSTDENFFFRGIAASFHKGNSRLHVFGSMKKSDANLMDDGQGNITFSSLQGSGYHRTLSEAEDKNSVRHAVTGAVYSLLHNNLKIGGTLLYEHFQYPFSRGTQLYQLFLFQGSENFNLSGDYRWVKGQYRLYGEAAISRSGGVALIQGLEARLHDQVSVTMLFRHYGRKYHATWAGAFGENSSANNETGFYTGFKILPAPRVTITGYADWFYSPWIKYTTMAPSRGNDFMIQTAYRFSRKMDAYVRLKSKEKAFKTKSGNSYLDETEWRNTFRVHFNLKPDEKFFLRSRFEAVGFRNPGFQKGLLVLQDFGWTPVKPSLTVVLRLSWFNTESYSTRIYAYENDLLYSFSTLAFYGRGIRSYLNLRYRISTKADCWLKVANTSWNDRDVISSGYSQIDGNSKTEFKFQFRYRF